MYLGSKQTAKHDHQNMAAERESKDSALVYGYERILQDCIHAFATKLEFNKKIANSAVQEEYNHWLLKKVHPSFKTSWINKTNHSPKESFFYCTEDQELVENALSPMERLKREQATNDFWGALKARLKPQEEGTTQRPQANDFWTTLKKKLKPQNNNP